jgi:hypothetical protein
LSLSNNYVAVDQVPQRIPRPDEWKLVRVADHDQPGSFRKGPEQGIREQYINVLLAVISAYTREGSHIDFKPQLYSPPPCTGVPMNPASRTAQVENLVDELSDLYSAQAADLREYAQATLAGEGTIHLERVLRRREVQRADLYRQFEQAAFPASQAPEVADQL